MDFQNFKNAVIAKCAEMGITEYELYYQCGQSTSVDTFQHSVNEFTSSQEGGVCFRCIVNGKMGYASTEALNEVQAAAIVERAADNASVLEAEEQVFLSEGGQEYEPMEDNSYPLPSTEEIISTILATQEKIYAASEKVIDGSQVQGIAESSEIAIYNSKGLDLHASNTVSGLIAVAVVSDGKEMANDYQVKLGQMSKIDADELVK